MRAKQRATVSRLTCVGWIALWISMCIGSINVRASEVYPIAEEISAEQAMTESLTVYPDGRGLPAGSGDAIAGKPLYLQHCAACHGSLGKNGSNSAIAGGVGTLTASTPNKTVGSYWPYAPTIFDYIRRAMPYNAPGTLTSNELYAVTAYVLRLNNIIPEDRVIDADSLPKVDMPNRSGFDWSNPPPS